MTDTPSTTSTPGLCDNCQQTVTTAPLDIGHGVITHLCHACWERLMSWRQKQSRSPKGRKLPVLPWPVKPTS